MSNFRIKVDPLQKISPCLGRRLVQKKGMVKRCASILGLLLVLQADMSCPGGGGGASLTPNFMSNGIDETNPKHHLLVAIQNNYTDPIIGSLLNSSEVSEQLKATDNEQNTPLHLAILRNRLTLVPSFLRKLTDLDLLQNIILKKNNNGYTPLHLAIKKERLPKTIQQLIEKNEVAINKDKTAIFGMKSNEGANTPLHLALKHGCEEGVIQELINKMKSEQLGVQNKEGYTPLHLAIKTYKSRNIVDKLIQKMEANHVSLESRNGKNTPLHLMITHELPYARGLRNNQERKEEQALIKKLAGDSGNEELHPKLTCSNKAGYSPLSLAITCGASDIVEMLIKHLSTEELMQADHKKRTPLHMAARCNQTHSFTSIWKGIVSKNKDCAANYLVNPDSNGKTVFACAYLPENQTSGWLLKKLGWGQGDNDSMFRYILCEVKSYLTPENIQEINNEIDRNFPSTDAKPNKRNATLRQIVQGIVNEK